MHRSSALQRHLTLCRQPAQEYADLFRFQLFFCHVQALLNLPQKHREDVTLAWRVSILADNPHFLFQNDSRSGLHLLLDQPGQFEKVAGRGSPGIDEKIGVLLCNLRAADAAPPESRLIDQPPSLLSGGVPEKGAGIRQVDPLGAAAMCQALIDSFSDYCRVSFLQQERCFDDDLTGVKLEKSVAEGQFRPLPRPQVPPVSEVMSSNRSSIASPWAPAFMLRAPPTVPGMPATNSSPARPC